MHVYIYLHRTLNTNLKYISPYSAYKYYKFKEGEQTQQRDKLLVHTYWPVILHALVFKFF